ncbi:hypothetical protein BJX62DRAFT_204176 [Aspergillus germanicus]
MDLSRRARRRARRLFEVSILGTTGEASFMKPLSSPRGLLARRSATRVLRAPRPLRNCCVLSFFASPCRVLTRSG